MVQLELDDLDDYLRLIHPDRAFHQLNGPYFKKQTLEELQLYVLKIKDRLKQGDVNPRRKMIVEAATNKILGDVILRKPIGWKSVLSFMMRPIGEKALVNKHFDYG